MKLTPNLVIGVILILVGAILVLDRLNLVQLHQAVQLWPVLLVLFGVSVVVDALKSTPDGQASDVRRPIISPGFVLFLVVAIVFATRFDDGRLRRMGGPTDSDMSLFGLMGRDDRVVLSSDFKHAQMTSVMGRTRLDLRKADMPIGSEATIEVLGVMGAVEIVVPPGWEVDLRTVTIMGGATDQRRRAATERNAKQAEAAGPDAAPLPSSPRLIVRGTIAMGGLVVKS